MTDLQRETVTGAEVEPARRRFLAQWATVGGLLLVVTMVGQAVASLGDDDQEVRDAWLTDVLAVAVVSSVFGAVAVLVALRALRGDEGRRSRTVVGLTVAAVVLSVAGWWSAAPHVTALAALLLGRTTGVSDRATGTPAARAASIVSLVVIAGLLVFTWTVVVLEQL